MPRRSLLCAQPLVRAGWWWTLRPFGIPSTFLAYSQRKRWVAAPDTPAGWVGGHIRLPDEWPLEDVLAGQARIENGDFRWLVSGLQKRDDAGSCVRHASG